MLLKDKTTKTESEDEQKGFQKHFFSKQIHDQRYHRGLLHFYKNQYLNNKNKLKLKIKIKKRRKNARRKKEKETGILGGQ